MALHRRSSLVKIDLLTILCKSKPYFCICIARRRPGVIADHRVLTPFLLGFFFQSLSDSDSFDLGSAVNPKSKRSHAGTHGSCFHILQNTFLSSPNNPQSLKKSTKLSVSIELTSDRVLQLRATSTKCMLTSNRLQASCRAWQVVQPCNLHL